MTYQANVYRVMLASPSDVKEERDEFPQILDTWNALHSFHEKAVILPVKWETHSTPEMGDRPQAIINKRIVKDSDILIGIFWTKLGTPTGIADSGSVEEVEEFRSEGKPVLLYFSSRPVVADSINSEQYQYLKTFREKCMSEGLVATYNSVSEFRETLLRHLLDMVRRIQRERPELTPPKHTSQDITSSDKQIEIKLEHSINRAFDEREEYKLRIDLINAGNETISNYRLDIEFPNAFLNQSTEYFVEVTERSNDIYKFFRITQEHHRNDPIYPGDSRTVFLTDYFMDVSVIKTKALNEHLRVRVFIDNKQVKIIDKSMSDLVSKDWQN